MKKSCREDLLQARSTMSPELRLKFSNIACMNAETLLLECFNDDDSSICNSDAFSNNTILNNAMLNNATLDLHTTFNDDTSLNNIVFNNNARQKKIALYMPIGSELDISALALSLMSRNFKLAFPIVVDDKNMEFYSFEKIQLVEIFDKLPHPLTPFDEEMLRDAQATLVDPKTLNAIITPGVGFSIDGYRLGYGKGYYDRYLTRTDPKCLTLGIAFEIQMKESIPTDSHDIKLNAIVTELNIYKCL